MIHNLSEQNSVFNHFLYQIRDIELQKDPLRFRRNIERMGEILAYEISKTLDYKTQEVTTPLASLEMNVLQSKIVISSVLRAGLPLHQGLLNYFDSVQNAFVGSYRKYHKDNTFEIESGYLSAPPMNGKILILADPMLASGSSMVLAYKDLCAEDKPLHTHIVTLIAAREGIEYLQENIPPKNFTLWVGAVDDELTAKSYIVPGLGDAGDLAYGSKEL